jgi:flavin-dependent dehydrogenase
MAAYELAGRSLRVLLVDKSAFPRPKVCGCCLNGQTLALLESRGLAHVIRENRAVPLRQVMLATNRHRANIPIPIGVALSREAFDLGLINSATQRGVNFLPQTRATLSGMCPSGCQIGLEFNGERLEVKSGLVLVADGLSGTFSQAFSQFGSRPIKGEESRIGAAVIVEKSPAFYGPETIYMACGSGGYVGLVRLEDGRLNIAAAFERQAMRRAGGPGRLAHKILNDAGLPALPEILQVAWKGTSPLRRRARNLAAERVFVLGDAASFVEPFTGEGIAWALLSAVAVAPLAAQASQGWNTGLEREWTEVYHQQVERRQLICRLTAATLRHPGLTTLAVQVLAFFPFLSRPVLRRLNTWHNFRKGTPL